MILDTSAILSLMFGQTHARWVADQLAAAPSVRMSMVNLTECLIRLHDRNLADADQLIARFTAMKIQFIPPDRAQAQLAAQARLRFPLNFGDCFAYALAHAHHLPLLTLDSDFRATDIQLILPPKL